MDASHQHVFQHECSRKHLRKLEHHAVHQKCVRKIKPGVKANITSHSIIQHVHHSTSAFYYLSATRCVSLSVICE